MSNETKMQTLVAVKLGDKFALDLEYHRGCKHVPGARLDVVLAVSFISFA